MKAKKQQCYQISGFVGFDLSVLGLDWRVEERVGEEIEWAGENNSGIVPGLQAGNLKNNKTGLQPVSRTCGTNPQYLH